MKTIALQGDCAKISGQIKEDFDLIYADVPFGTGISQVGRAASYTDKWGTENIYINDIGNKIKKVLNLLSPKGVAIIHCDWRTAHLWRILLESKLGNESHINHLIWQYGLGGSSNRRFARKHDDILVHSPSKKYYFEPPMVPATSQRLKGKMKKATDILNIPALNNMAHERTGYPTQKPLQLLKTLINAFCPPNGKVLDPFCGSGTTLVAAAITGREAMGIDISKQAISICQKRLREISNTTSDVHL